MADGVLAVMDHLKLDPASFVGWSDGGEIAMKLAIHHPARVAKLVIENYDAKGAKLRTGKPSVTFGIYAQKYRADDAKLSKTRKRCNDVIEPSTFAVPLDLYPAYAEVRSVADKAPSRWWLLDDVARFAKLGRGARGR